MSALRRRYGIRTVRGATLPELMAAWGEDDARDRLFQLDLLRRFAAGRLSELVGAAAVDLDREQRTLRLAWAADRAVGSLPAEQLTWLQAYTDGVNRRIARRQTTVEHRLLSATVQPWQPRDSLLVLLGLAQQLALDVDGERTRAVLAATLPAAVVDFLLPREDEYGEAARPDAELPAAALAEAQAAARHLPVVPVVGLSPTGASNCWVVGGARTTHGTPILANDLHLATAAPNLLRRVDLALGARRIRGFAVPGVPVVACGSNGRVAWGVANIPADYTRLVPVRADEQVEDVEETIAVRGADPVRHRLQVAVAGPVLPTPLLGERVALQWAAHRPRYVDLSWVRLLEVATAAEAAAVVTVGGGLPLVVLAADADGGLVRTVGGRFPRRSPHGSFDGSSDGTGLLPGDEDPQRLPRQVGTPSDVLVATNDPPAPRPGQVEIGRNYPTAYRRARIADVLARPGVWDEAALAALQLDAAAGLLDGYPPFAREGAEAAAPAVRTAALAALTAWDGTHGPDSIGSSLLWAFRAAVQRHLLASVLRGCAAAEPGFRFAWRNPEPVVRCLLRERPDGLLHGVDGATDSDPWRAFLAARVTEAAEAVADAAGRPVDRARWRDVLTVRVPHPLGGTRWTRWLNLPPLRPVGGPESVAAHATGRGPVLRLVVAPGHEDRGLVGMPGGQSGNPFSPHYRDQHRDWRRGRLASLVLPARRWRR